LGQKTNPIGLRLTINKTWSSKWFAPKSTYRDLFLEDLTIKRYTRRRLADADISQIEILRSPNKVTLNIYTARPGVVIGQSGQRIEEFKQELEYLTKKEVQLNVLEIRYPELDAYLVATNIARQIEGRISHRRAMKRAIAQAMRMGALGIKIKAGGRLAGAEIAHSEEYKEGRVPLHTLRADIDFARATAHTTYGCVGVKVWIYKGDILGGRKEFWERVLEEEEKGRKKFVHLPARASGGGRKKKSSKG
jgi:small subunit ribosomal protein S3